MNPDIFQCEDRGLFRQSINKAGWPLATGRLPVVSAHALLAACFCLSQQQEASSQRLNLQIIRKSENIFIDGKL